MNRRSFAGNPSTRDKFGIAIMNARRSLKLSQDEFVDYLYTRSNGSITLSKSAIESYETGCRMPKMDLGIEIAKTLGLSIDEIYGIEASMDPPSEPESPVEIEAEGFTLPQIGKAISVKLYKYFDKMPVYVISSTKAIPSGWAILNASAKVLVFSNATYKIDSKVNNQITLYDTKPIFAMTISGEKLVPMNMDQLMKCNDAVYVSYLSDNTSITSVYNGWYRRDKTGLFLVSRATGAVLPCEGIGLTYNAYKIPGAAF